ncbi:MAG: hypothetical protein RJA36_1941 [Pseudomonadota bacterium]
MSTINGTFGKDTLTGGAGVSDQIDGGGGFDYVDYLTSPWTVTVNLATGMASDTYTIDWLSNIEAVRGSFFNDTITGNDVDNVLDGGAGNDTLKGGLGNDTLDGGAGSDTADYSDKTAGVSVTLNGAIAVKLKVGGVEEDSLKDIENLIGGSAADRLTGDSRANMLVGNAGDDILSGDLGNDTLQGGLGKDTLDGGDGIDTADYSDKTAGVSVTLNGGTAVNVSVGGVVEDSIRSIENLIGGSSDDRLSGDAQANMLVGNAGADILNGGKGADVVTGGAGKDTFVFAAGDSGQVASSIDRITDYAKGTIGMGDLIDFGVDLVTGGVAAAATSSRASINATTGVAAFAAGSGATLDDALADVAKSLSLDGVKGAAKDVAGEFAFFKVNGAGDYYLFISDGVAGVSAKDMVVQLMGVNVINTIDLAGGNLTISS